MSENQELDKLVENTVEKINQKSLIQPRNRAERRALAKKLGKTGRAHVDLITETAEKLNYIDLIQKLRALNAKKETENNDERTN